MLRFAGYTNIAIALGHVVGLIWADWMFEVTGVGKDMNELSEIHASLPYLLTLFVAVIFFIFGLYALSASGGFRKLPFINPVIFVIAGIYLARGFGEIIVRSLQGSNGFAETSYSVIAILIGLSFLFGGIGRWRKDHYQTAAPH